MTRENLEKQRIASEEERKNLVGLISQLEHRLAEQRQNAEEERWNLRQETSRLDAATKALEKERDRAMQQIERERQQLQAGNIFVGFHRLISIFQSVVKMEFSARFTHSSFSPQLWEVHSAPRLLGTYNFLYKEGNHIAHLTAYTCLLLQSRMHSASLFVMVVMRSMLKFVRFLDFVKKHEGSAVLNEAVNCYNYVMSMVDE